MQSCCKYNSICLDERGRHRPGLTLIELVVVLAILVALSGLVIPVISGLGSQTNASTNATLISDVNRAVGAFYARGGDVSQYPDAWDSLLNTNGTLFSKLHPALSGTNPTAYGDPLLQVVPLTQQQSDSLRAVGINQLYRADELSTVAPSLNVSGTISVAIGAKVAMLVTTTVNSSAYDKLVFGRDFANVSGGTTTDGQFVVFGVGYNSTLRGATMMDVPLVQAADPNNYYARVLCVFMVPNSGTDPAKYVGCFLPDGTSLRNNLEKYNNSVASN